MPFKKSDILLKHHCFVILAHLFYKWVPSARIASMAWQVHIDLYKV
jgi:hypothetical protein